MRVVGMAVVVAWLSACGSCAERASRAAVESATGVKVDEAAGTVTMKGPDGQQVEAGENQKPPADLPVPATPELKVLVVTRAPPLTSAMLSSTTAPAALAAQWEAALKGKGFTVERTSTTTAGVESELLSFKSDAEEGAAQLQRDTSGQDPTMITMSWQKRAAE